MAERFQTEHIAVPPRGYHVRTVTTPSGAEVRLAFPPGPRKRGSGRLVSILHPRGSNPAGLLRSLCSDPDFTSQVNPQAISYLKAAEKAAKGGNYIRAKTLFGKYSKKKTRELAAEPPPRRNARASVNDPYGIRDSEVVRAIPGRKRKRVSRGPQTPRSSGAAYQRREAAAGQYMEQLAKKVSGKRNPADAEQLYEDFHGRAPSEVLELQERLLKTGDYTAIGDDPEFWLTPVPNSGGWNVKWPSPDIAFTPEEGVKVAMDAGGKQLYFVGGGRLSLTDLKENAELRGISLDTSKRFIALGTLYGISYLTEKSFDGFKTSVYAHELGEETGERPQLFYDKQNARLILAGGAYSIAPVKASLGASPGIIN